MTTTVQLQILDNSAGLPLPSYATANSAGMDLLSANYDDIIIKPGQRILVRTGIAIALPWDMEAQIRPRSGLALKHGITVLNTPGTIDADYRGEIAVILINLGEEEFTVSRGMRIAQMVIATFKHAEFNVVTSLQETARSSGGFGSTGTKMKEHVIS